MDISAIIYAAFGGGIGGIFGALLGKFIGFIKDNKSLQSGISVLCIVGGYTATTSLYKNMYLPRIGSSALAEFDEVMPFLPYIREQNPEIYKEMVFPLDKIARNNQITQDGINQFRSKFQDALDVKKKNASAETLKYENAVVIELFEILKERAPQACTQKFYGRPYVRLDEFVDDNYIKKETIGFSRYFTDSPRDASFKINVEEGKTLFSQIYKDIIQEFEITEIDPPVDDIEANKKICDLQITLNTKLNALSESQFLNTMSFLQGFN